MQMKNCLSFEKWLFAGWKFWYSNVSVLLCSFLSCWCIIYVCWEAFSSIQIKIFEEKTPANWIILQRRIKVKLLIEFSKYNTIVQIWCQTQSKWLDTNKYNISMHKSSEKMHLFSRDVTFWCTIPFAETCVCLSIFQMFECFFLIRFLFKCLQLLVCLAGSQSFYKWKIQ